MRKWIGEEAGASPETAGTGAPVARHSGTKASTYAVTTVNAQVGPSPGQYGSVWGEMS